MQYHANDTNEDFIKGSVPIPSQRVLDFYKQLEINLEQTIFDYDCLQRYKETYSDWIQSTKLNKLKNLHKFTWVSYSAGTSESFINFTTRYNHRRFRTFKAEFVFHRLNCKNNSYNFCCLEDDTIQQNDAVIISLPYSDIGDKHPEMENIIDQCNIKGVPVLIDCAYMILAKNIEFDFDHPCIDTITFSLSKGFWGIDKLRLGIRFQRKDRDDNLDIFNKWKTVPLHSIAIGEKILKTFDPDWLWNTYGTKYLDVCKSNSLHPTNSICHAIGGEEYKHFNRGGDHNRVCVSNSLSDVE